MTEVAWLRRTVFVLCLLCGRVSAQIEGLFTGIEPPVSQNGLVIEIALTKQAYFLFEPVTVLARFRNVTDRVVAVVLEGHGLSGIDSKLSWEQSSLDGKQRHPNVGGSALQNVFLIPEHGTVYFALPDKMFPVGTTKLSIQYRHSQEYRQTPIAGAEVWQGQIRSNEVVVVVQDKKTLTPEEQTLIKEKIDRHIALFSSGDWQTRYLAEGHLVLMSRYSVPALVECLKHENSSVRESAIDALARIANKRIAEEAGFERDISFLDALLSAYDRERNPETKSQIVYALWAFRDLEPEKLTRIVQTLRKAFSHTDKSLRKSGAVILLRVSKEDVISEVIDRIGDDTYFGDEGRRIVVRVLEEETGQHFGTSTSEWKAWWQQNKTGRK
jgi:hypothetical protein